jgi:hypothetical protein
VSEHLCQGDWGGNFSREILHFGKFGLGFLDILSLIFFQPRRRLHVRLHMGGRAETIHMRVRTVCTSDVNSRTVCAGDFSSCTVCIVRTGDVSRSYSRFASWKGFSKIC